MAIGYSVRFFASRAMRISRGSVRESVEGIALSISSDIP